ncbi:MAG: M48 family metallopeptidase [Acidiferrobacterales bacterium]|nr:M48 family metallopeptidase [Acidiferrobacterales bacterium]
MNFFEHQDKARRQSRWIIAAFIAVALLITLAVNLIVLAVLALQPALSSGVATITHGGLGAITSPQLWAANSGLLLGSSLATGGVIGVASLGKIASLRAGGGKVARDMGGVIVTPDTRDPLRRRLYNVVEEIALASGTPVPEVYVMENEPAINAFAAGYTASDAAVAVTQGTLEKLNRSELQGVIAHEFSHIFNGDMRINIRMMGIIFGIMVIAILGRKFVSSQRYRSRSSKDNGSAAVAIGLALMLVGYIGLFFARWMKSALSRQREYLADASAVQFTREPDGIAGALKKIAAYNHSSYLKSDSEEVSHMLFSSGYRSLMFATHPPLVNRIARIEKGFDGSEIGQLATKLKAQERREHVQAELAEKEQQKKLDAKSTGGIFDVNSMIENIGNPEFERILAAALLSSHIPGGLASAARSLEWAPEVLLLCLLDDNESVREKQLLIVVQQMGDISERKLSHLASSNPKISPEQRLPLLEICFPALKRRPVSDIEDILTTINMLALADNRVDSFEYLLSRLVAKYLRESKDPSRSKLHGKRKLKDCIEELSIVVSAMATHGQLEQGTQGLQTAQHAYRAGMESIGIKHTNLQFKDNWQARLDKALIKLDELTPQEKNKVVSVLAITVSNDEKLVTEEHEMLRAICSMIHVPLPILQKASLG